MVRSEATPLFATTDMDSVPNKHWFMYHQVKRSWLLSAPCIRAGFYVIQAFKVVGDTLLSLLCIFFKAYARRTTTDIDKDTTYS